MAGGSATDQLLGGAELTLTLNADGITSGRFFVPGGDEGGADFDADLAGVWSFDDDTGTLVLDHAADTFLRDVTFEAVRADGDVELRASRTFGGTTIEVVLERQ